MRDFFSGLSCLSLVLLLAGVVGVQDVHADHPSNRYRLYIPNAVQKWRAKVYGQEIGDTRDSRFRRRRSRRHDHWRSQDRYYDYNYDDRLCERRQQLSCDFDEKRRMDTKALYKSKIAE